MITQVLTAACLSQFEPPLLILAQQCRSTQGCYPCAAATVDTMALSCDVGCTPIHNAVASQTPSNIFFNPDSNLTSDKTACSINFNDEASLPMAQSPKRCGGPITSIVLCRASSPLSSSSQNTSNAISALV